MLDVAAGATARRDRFRFASPLWSFEELPGVTDEERAAIGAARGKFVAALLESSRNLTEATEAGRELDTGAVGQYVTGAVRRFFVESNVAEIVSRALDRLAQTPQRPKVDR